MSLRQPMPSARRRTAPYAATPCRRTGGPGRGPGVLPEVGDVVVVHGLDELPGHRLGDDLGGREPDDSLELAASELRDCLLLLVVGRGRLVLDVVRRGGVLRPSARSSRPSCRGAAAPAPAREGGIVVEDGRPLLSSNLCSMRTSTQASSPRKPPFLAGTGGGRPGWVPPAARCRLGRPAARDQGPRGPRPVRPRLPRAVRGR